PQLAGQYRAIWKACVEASQGKHHLALAAYGCEPERHTSHVLAQLACLLSQRQSTRILLVDGNLSTQTLSKGFQVTERPGLVEIAAGARDWRECIVETSSPNLFVLPAGIGSDQPFLSERVMSGVRALAADFDFVLIDAGVVGDAYMPSLVAASDRSLLVVRLGKTKREHAQAAIATLKQLELGTHGCIVTNV
ncbi:MAG: cellulose synthase operon protein YhjQ/BcsQ, partial [Planctomycetota bacterium]